MHGRPLLVKTSLDVLVDFLLREYCTYYQLVISQGSSERGFSTEGVRARIGKVAPERLSIGCGLLVTGAEELIVLRLCRGRTEAI